MKKLFFALLCTAVFFLSCAHAEALYDVWALNVVDIVVSMGNQAVSLHPTVEVNIGSDESCDHGWLTCGVRLNGEKAVDEQIEYDAGVLRFSANGAKDCVYVNDGDHYALLYSMMIGLDPGMDAKTMLHVLRTQLETPEAFYNFLQQIPEIMLVAEPLGEDAYRVHISAAGLDIHCRMLWSHSSTEQKAV